MDQQTTFGSQEVTDGIHGGVEARKQRGLEIAALARIDQKTACTLCRPSLHRAKPNTKFTTAKSQLAIARTSRHAAASASTSTPWNMSSGGKPRHMPMAPPL